VGDPVPSSGCLFAYRFSENEVTEELAFTHDKLWLSKVGT
jgi:hypothetical protein